jgi:hypothetical protein
MNVNEMLTAAAQKLASYREKLHAPADIKKEIEDAIEDFLATVDQAAKDENGTIKNAGSAVGKLYALRKLLEGKTEATSEELDTATAIGKLIEMLSQKSIQSLRVNLAKLMEGLSREDQAAVFQKATGHKDVNAAVESGLSLEDILQKVTREIEARKATPEIVEGKIVEAPMPPAAQVSDGSVTSAREKHRPSAPAPLALHYAEPKELLEIAKILHTGGMFATRFKSAEQIFTAMLLGMAYRIPPITALTSINVINGQPAMSANLMLALAQSSGELENLKIESAQDECCVTIKRRGYSSPIVSRFTVEDAKKMGLLERRNWQQQPQTMLRWRAIVAGLRLAFADILLGLYTFDELGDEESIEE